ncbi:MAG: tetratricopeptide repeat protein [Phycisphaerae bacterium]
MSKRAVTGILVLAGWMMACGCDGMGTAGTGVNTDAAIDHYVQAQIHRERDNSDAALDALGKAIRDDPTLAVAHESMGDIYRKRESYKLAARSYEESCRINPYGFRQHYNLGVTYQYLADAAESLKEMQANIRKAVDVYLRAITIDPSDFDANINLSACYYQLGRYAQAEQYCKRALELKPGSASAYSNLGTIYDAQGRPYKAISAYKTALETDSSIPRLRLNLGSTYMRQGTAKSLNTAIDLFGEAADRNPRDAAPHELMGLSYFYLRDYDKSLAAYERALKRDPNSAAAHRGVGVALMSLYVKTKDTALRDRALKAWHRSLEIDDRQPKLIRLIREFSPKVTAPEIGS